MHPPWPTADWNARPCRRPPVEHPGRPASRKGRRRRAVGAATRGQGRRGVTGATFVLVHGAWQGGWAFEEVINGLRAQGHAAVAVELPGSDETLGLSDYAATVADVARSAGHAVVVVGHSMAGLFLPLVPRRNVPIAHLVFLCCPLAAPGYTLTETIDRYGPTAVTSSGSDPGMHEHPNGTSTWDVPGALRVLYCGCNPAAARRASGRLRPQVMRPFAERAPEWAISDHATSAVLCEDDIAVPPGVFAPITRALLGVDPIVISGGHTPQVTHPDRIVQLLLDVSGGG